MSDRNPQFDDVFEDQPDSQVANLRETLAYWSEPVEEEEPSEEEQLASFLEALGKSDSRNHTPSGEEQNNTVGRRTAPRLRLSLPARFVAVERTHQCILLNISRTGAQIAILDTIREGEGGFLHCGSFSAFAIVARSEFSLNGLEFDEPISDEEVLEIRRYYENFEERERRQLIETARKWVNGETDDGRAI
jgi:hypothetical protein